MVHVATDRRDPARHRGFWLAVLLAGLVACGGPASDVRCAALASLRSAVRAVELAEAAERAGDGATVRRRVDELTRLIGRARTSLAGGTDGHTRRLLEAANYLEFIAGEFGRTGFVDGTLAQFASRELNRSVPGQPPLPC